jgi:pyruvate/2-oxoglutarate dehydrogenase complex dihydrolipoamide acyltransferase (E2) component
MTEVLFPQLSDEDPDGEGVLASWFVDEGATVAGGDLIAEVMVGKVTSEVRAPVPGAIHRTAHEEDVVRQRSVIATIT